MERKIQKNNEKKNKISNARGKKQLRIKINRKKNGSKERHIKKKEEKHKTQGNYINKKKKGKRLSQHGEGDDKDNQMPPAPP